MKFTYKEQREYETIDEDIAKLEEKLASIERQITANATNSVKLRELMEKQENCATELEEKEKILKLAREKDAYHIRGSVRSA